MRILIVTMRTMKILLMMKSSSVVCTSEQVYVANCTSFCRSMKTVCSPCIVLPKILLFNFVAGSSNYLFILVPQQLLYMIP